MATTKGVATETVMVTIAGGPEWERRGDVARRDYVEIGFGRQGGAAVPLG